MVLSSCTWSAETLREVGFVQDSGTFHFDIILSRITLCFHLFSFVPILCLHAGSVFGLYFHLSAFQLNSCFLYKEEVPIWVCHLIYFLFSHFLFDITSISESFSIKKNNSLQFQFRSPIVSFKLRAGIL